MATANGADDAAFGLEQSLGDKRSGERGFGTHPGHPLDLHDAEVAGAGHERAVLRCVTGLGGSVSANKARAAGFDRRCWKLA